MASFRSPVAAVRALPTRMFVVVAASVVAFGLLPMPAAHAVEGLRVDAQTTYRLDPEKGKVHVTVTARLENTMPARTTGAYISTPYFDSFAVPTFGPVTNARASSSAGGSLDVDVEEGRLGISGVVADLSPNLVYGAPQTVTIEFDLPGQPPRSDSITRVNKGFASWFVFGAGDPGNIDIRIAVPTTFQITLSKPVGTKITRRGPLLLYEMDNVREFDHAALFASATNEDEIPGKQFDVGGTKVTVKAWPGDAPWQRFAMRWTRTGMPVLEKLIGLEPRLDDLTIAESSRSYQLGFAGFYVPSEERVEVGDLLDKSTLLHELAHVWFNQRLFEERWLGEGLAESYANRALAELGERPRPPKRIDVDDPARVALNEWPPIAVLDPERAKVETYAYNASYSVIEALIDEIGVDGMRKVFAAASKRAMTYPGDPAAEERTEVDRDWRYFFDLVETVGGSKQVDDIFIDQVLTPAQEALLPQRFDARRQLDLLNETGKGWTAPLEVREELGAWEFREASDLMEEATELLERSQATIERLDEVEVEGPAWLEEQYEGADSLRNYDEVLAELETATDEIVELRTSTAESGPIARIGLIGSDAGHQELNQAVADNELDRVPDIVAAASTTLDEATGRGGTLLAAFLLVLVLGVVVVKLLRRRHKAAGEASADDITAPGEQLHSEQASVEPDESERV